MKKQLILFLMMLLPMAAWADDSGTCGDNVTWTYEEATQTLTISGSGAMYDYNLFTPWRNYTSNIIKVVIEDGVTSIGNCAFYYCSFITSITIPNNITSIGVKAFEKCSSLTSINIPNGVTIIGSEAFYNCTGLTSLTIPNGVTSIGGNAFTNCLGLTSIVIPNGVTSIGNGTFQNCKGLTSIIIPNSVTSIGDKAFYGCTSLKTITIPNGVTSISNSEFYGCSGLTSITIPNSVTSIGDEAFVDCSGLTAITIPDGVTSIGVGAFYGCTSLKTITIPNGVTSISNSEFYGCSGLTSINIPNGVTSIGRSAYSRCYGLTSINIPQSVTLINDEAFSRCYGLTSITIPDGVTIIANKAFQNCQGLTSVVLPSNLTIIREKAFDGCYGLTNLTIPASVQYIYQEAFAGCTSLEMINALPTTPPFLYDNSFSDFNVPVYVPVGCVDAYKTAQGWQNFTNINDGTLSDMTVTVGDNGSIMYGTQTVKNSSKVFKVQKGTNVELTIIPDDDYRVATLTVNGVDALAQLNNGVLTISNMTANTTVAVTFELANTTKKVTLTESMGTFCSTEDLDFTNVSGLAAYIGSGFNTQTGVLTMTRVYDVPAGTGIVLVGSAGSYDVPYSTSHSIYANLLKGVTEDIYISQTSDGYSNYILTNGSHGLGFYLVSGSGLLAKGKAYLRIPTQSQSAPAMFSLDFDDGMTGINSTKGQQREQQEWYDLQGRRITNPTKPGLYIKNGKKVSIR